MSKYRWVGDPFMIFFWKKSLTMPKKLKGWTLWGFSTSILSQNIKKLKGDPLSKFFSGKKSLTMPKKLKGGPFGLCETPVGCKMLLQCHSAENCKRGDPLGFLDIHCVAKYKKIEGETFWWNPKSFKKKSHSAEKKSKWKTPKGYYVFEVLDVDVFVFDEVLAFRVCFGRP